jgi:hypothetical protein
MAKQYTFEISLSVLEHLGRNLYRSFATVLGEAISNAWDADAKKVYIFIPKGKNEFFIKDDGLGMDEDDFQEKFLRIGYSKRGSGHFSKSGRPFIGRKGIGKLALLSCAQKVTVISKKSRRAYIGGTIDNSGLDKAIKDDIKPQDYELGNFNIKDFGTLTRKHAHGAIIHFENLREKFSSNLLTLRKILALYFRFSLIDKSFRIYINDVQVTLSDLDDLAKATQFVWRINGLRDPYLSNNLNQLDERPISTKMAGDTKGFIASVRKPSNLKIGDTEERAGVDLFVNGRLRERDILKHIPTLRITESYFYGQIHFDQLDDDQDRFTSSREGIVADDPKFQKFLEILRKKILELASNWDRLRRKHKDYGDPEAGGSRRERRAEELYNEIAKDYSKRKARTKQEKLVENWVTALGNDAKFNFASYGECYVSENLIRQHIKHKKIKLSPRAKDQIADIRKKERENKGKGNIVFK